MFAILSRLFILFINEVSRDRDNTKMLLNKLFIRYLVVKRACVNAATAMFEVVVPKDSIVDSSSNG